MCGIAGIVHIDRKVQPEILSKMGQSLAHRGPDGNDTWVSESKLAGFAHCRLSIIDLSSGGKQPMHYLGKDGKSKYSIVHNGEIYNYIELREKLEKKGHAFRTNTDTEVILAAYDEWKDDCLQQFDGMFAFALWNESMQCLFAARDRFGEKPFFYCYQDEKFVFGSEIKAIRAAGINPEPNRGLLFNFITIGYTDNPSRPEETFFYNIYKLPASSYLRFYPATKNIQVKKYWEIDPQSINRTINEAEAKEKFSELLSVSVKRRLRSDVPIGTSLSGGIDSSSIASLSHSFKSNQQSYKSFTVSFPGYEKDETGFSALAAKHLNLQSFISPVTVSDFLSDWEIFFRQQEEPVGSAGAYAQYRLYKLAKEQGVKVLLDGQGADELLAGYTKYYKWYWQELFHNRKLFRSKEIPAARALGVREKFGARNIVASLFPDIATVILERRYLVKALRHEDLEKEFIMMQSRQAYYDRPDTTGLNGILYFDSFVHGLEELLRYADRNAMAHGREVRLPFLSHELAEFIFSLPSHFKIRNGWTKWLLRESMQDRLPRDITWRRDKIGFEPPQAEWMLNEKLQELIRDAKKKMVENKILKPSAVDKPIIPLGAHEPDNYDWRYLSASILFA